MALELNGSTGVSLVQDGVVTAADLASTLDLTGKTVTLPAGVGGKVLQVVQTVFSSNATTSSSSFTASGMSASITPSSASSKILIIVAIAGHQTASNGGGIFTIYRGATNIGDASDGFQYLYTNASYSNPFRIPINMVFLDSPSTTSSTTYEVYFKTNTVGTVGINDQSTRSTITLMEIAA
jgi:hypothetical protein